MRLSAITIATFTRIHWNHDFSAREPRIACNDDLPGPEYFSHLTAAMIRQSFTGDD